MKTTIAAILIVAALALPADAQGFFRRQTPWQIWSQQCAVRNWGGRLPDYCINAYRAVTGR